MGVGTMGVGIMGVFGKFGKATPSPPPPPPTLLESLDPTMLSVIVAVLVVTILGKKALALC